MQPNTAPAASPIAPRYLRVAEASRYTSLSVSFLNNGRSNGEGPPFIRASDKSRGVVLYCVDDLDAWLLARRRVSTSTAPA